MHLHSLTVENFRALRAASVSFDDTTVLIGENDCGKSSLLEALALALDPEASEAAPRFQPYHFHRHAPHADAPASGPIGFALRFRERQPGEWDALADSPLGALFGPVAGSTRRELVLDIRAEPAAGGEAVADWSLRLDDTAARPASSDPQALAFLRRMNPLIWLHGGGMIHAPGTAGHRERRARSLPPEAAQLVERIEQSHAAVLAGTAPDIQATLTEGFDAAREFIAFAARHLGGQRHNFRQMVAEILDSQRVPPADTTVSSSLPHFAGSAAERIGVLALMAALLRAIPDTLVPGAEPIWVIEDPEAELHPMTLAAVLNLIGHIKWQKIITTQSGEVLAAEPLACLRRLTRHAGTLREWRVRPRSLSAEDLRRVGYHLRGRRGVASFARCWLLVEGETEFWVLPELARIAGHDFDLEGIVCVEFAQCGLRPLIKLARELGIEWHVLTDGDRAGQHYVEEARRFIRSEPQARRVTALRERDIENCFYEHGYAAVYRRLANVRDLHIPARRVIERAIDRHSKPMLALELILAAAARGSPGAPAPLARMIDTCVNLAREAPGREPVTASAPIGKKPS